jgi:hypothetical protein
MRSIARLLPLSLLALPFIACSSDKNHAERDDAAKRDPSYMPIDYNDAEAMKKACVGACRTDPGSKPVKVAEVEAGYQFAWMWDFANEPNARATFTYDDNTTDFVVPFRTPSTTGYGTGGWEPIPDAVPLAWQGPTQAVRFKGGPFTEYGGGVGMSLRTISNAPKDVAMPRANPAIALLEQAPSAEFPDPTGGAYDVSAWEGLAVWVRRGPDGQSTMRLGLTERNSAEDLNSSAVLNVMMMHPQGVEEGKYCRRWRYCGCSGTTPCSPVPGSPIGEQRCFDPAIENPTIAELSDQIKYPHCGVSRCKDKNSSTIGPDEDVYFKDKQCAPAVTSDGHSDLYCYDPGVDPTPPSKRERCGNPFSRAITVSTDWQLIKVPFTDLRQADEAQVAGGMDLHSVKQVAFTYAGGWVDFWVANIGFYRKQ